MAITDASEGQTEEVVKLLKTRSVLSLRSEGQQTVFFSRTSEEFRDGAGIREVWFETLDWKEMGRPSQITITIEPGDKLND